MSIKIKYFLSAIALIISGVIITVFLISGSAKNSSPVVNADEVRAFLTAETKNPQLETINSRIKFFAEKVQKDNFGPVTTGMLAGAYSARFGISGDINDLVTSDSLWKMTGRKYNGTKTSVYQSLSMNSLARHEFKKSLDYAYNAYLIGEHKNISEGMIFDAYIETGNYEEARRLLNSQRNNTEFSYLIRASKYKEITGDIDSALIFMSLALDIAKSNPTRPGLITWTNNSLAAIYIKAENYGKAYELYLNSLKLDPNNYKALEGIAVIASVNDKNYALAEEILLDLSKRLLSPDPYLNMYKVAKLQGDNAKKKEYLDKFITISSDPKYGKMYNKYLAEISADEFSDFNKALNIAQSEISERPTPASYFLLAWIYSKQGDYTKAIDIIKNNVEDKTFDPEILAKIDRIYLNETKKM
ncbi:MAG: hypothetical protein ABI543_07975 [Ignavibacteria bacterium]